MRLAQPLAGLRRQPVAEDGAEGVVGLVLEAAGQQPVPAELDRLAVQAGAGDRRASRAGRTRRTRRGRTGSPRRPRRGCGPCPPGSATTGLQTTPTVCVPLSSGQSKQNTARSTPIWQAARPTPSAAYMVATMSATRLRSSSSYVVTGWLRRCMTSVPQRVIGRTVPPSGSGPCGARGSSGMAAILGADRVTTDTGNGRCPKSVTPSYIDGHGPDAPTATHGLAGVGVARPDRRPGRRPQPAGPERRCSTGSGCASRPSALVHGGHPQRLPHARPTGEPGVHPAGEQRRRRRARAGSRRRTASST